MFEIENNRIREAWFLFPRSHLGLIRLICWLAIWSVSILFVVPESVTSLSNAYLIFTLSMIMEFYPNFGKYPDDVSAKNRNLIRREKIYSIVFLIILASLFGVSFYLVFSISQPKFFTLANVKTMYVLLYVFVFIYLSVNCVLGMVYTPKMPKETEDKMNKWFDAAEGGELGYITQKQT